MYIIISIFAAYALGIISYVHGFYSYFFTAVLVLLIYSSFITRKFIYNVVIITFLVFSFINCNYNSIYNLKQYINEDVIIVAEINRKNKVNAESNYASYQATVTSINNNVLKEKENTIIYFNKTLKVEENSIIQINGRVADSQFSKNKMLFNYNNYLRSKKIGAIIFSEDYINTIKEEFSLFNKISIKFRNYTEETFYKSLNTKNADIILSIILGDSDYLDENLYDNIKLMGLAHIFAVSGTHIVLMYGVLLTVLKYCFLSRRTSWVISWVLIWFYGFLIGFPLTVLRALVMFTLLFGSEVFYRKYNSLNSLGFAALVLTIVNPYWIFDAGFLMSFSAALSFIIYNKYISRNVKTKNLVLKTIYMYLFLQLFTLPVLAYFFNYVSIMGILYNLLLLPIFTFILTYGFVLLILNSLFSNLLIIPFKVYNYMLYSLRYFINFSEEFAFNGVVVPSLSFALIMFYYIMLVFILYLLNNENSRIAKCGVAILISFCCVNFIIIPFSDCNLYFNVADASQGLFTTVKYKNINLIFDCGSTSSKNFGKYTALPYIIKRGITNIDGIFISHWDLDHYSGLEELINNVKVKKVFASAVNEEINGDVIIIKKESSMKLDKHFSIDVFWPEENYKSDSMNNISLVILLNYNNQKILVTGDIEEEVENNLINDLCAVDILVVPHHGSKTSSTDAFVEKTNPNVAVLSYGRNNYGIPSNDVINRYEKENSIILSTFSHGEINFILKDDKVYYNTYIKEKSDNYFELYLIGLIPNIINLCLLFVWIINNKGEKHEL